MARRRPASASAQPMPDLDVIVTQMRAGVGVASVRLSPPASEWGLNRCIHT